MDLLRADPRFMFLEKIPPELRGLNLTLCEFSRIR